MLPGRSPRECEIAQLPEHVVQFLPNHKEAKASNFLVDEDGEEIPFDNSDPLERTMHQLQDKVVREIREYFEREPNPMLTDKSCRDHQGTIKIRLEWCPHKGPNQEKKDGGPCVFVNSDGTYNFSCQHKRGCPDKQDWKSVEAALGKKLHEPRAEPAVVSTQATEPAVVEPTVTQECQTP